MICYFFFFLLYFLLYFIPILQNTRLCSKYNANLSDVLLGWDAGLSGNKHDNPVQWNPMSVLHGAASQSFTSSSCFLFILHGRENCSEMMRVVAESSVLSSLQRAVCHYFHWWQLGLSTSTSVFHWLIYLFIYFLSLCVVFWQVLKILKILFWRLTETE